MSDRTTAEGFRLHAAVAWLLLVGLVALSPASLGAFVFGGVAAAPPPPASACTIWSAGAVPGRADVGADSAVELGVKFRADVDGSVTGVRFYKGTGNTGAHEGHLWTKSGTLLASVTFAGETASGWQEATFPTPVAITAGTTYVISYHTNVGHYAADLNYFASAGADNAPLHALRSGVDGSNGVFAYGPTQSFPTGSYYAANYWVDVVFSPSAGDVTPPTVAAVTPSAGQSDINPAAAVTATFSEPMDASTITTSTFALRDASGVVVPASVTYDAARNLATLAPATPLEETSTYEATVVGGTVDPRVKDAAGNALASSVSWSFTTSGPVPSEGPGGPILVIVSPANPFGRYYGEILRAEGLNEFEVMDVTNVSATVLASYDVAILGNIALTPTQVTMLTDWVTAGGNLIAMRPDKQLAGLLGLSDAFDTLANAYLLIDTTKSPGAGLVNKTIQFHGTADRYVLTGATEVAGLYADSVTDTGAPAVTTRTVGTGQAAAFTFDLARSVVYTRQGNPAWSGQERDGQAPVRSDDLFYGASSADPQANWVDLSKVAIPQADEQQRLLANLILKMTIARRPLPRFWYLPKGLKAAVVLTGDDHDGGGTAGRFADHVADSPAGCSVDNWECVRSTSYIYPTSPFSDSQLAPYTALGFEVALHLSTNCADWTPSSLDGMFTDQLTRLKAEFPSLLAPVTNRNHCIAWSDYDSEPQIELAHGIRLDTNYYFWPAGWVNNTPGMFTGSGMPMRFAKRDGTIIDVYQATTQMTDESGQTYPSTINTLLDNAVGSAAYYGVFTANMHTDTPHSTGGDAIISSAQSRGVPVVSAAQMLRWLDGRNGSSFKLVSWSAGVLTFSVSIASGATGLMAMLPLNGPNGAMTSLTLNGSPVTYTTPTLKGIAYAQFPAQAGTYRATYPFPGVQLSPASLDFGSQLVATTSAARTVTMSNNGSAALSITGIAASGDFAITTTCGSTLNAGASCTVSVRFTPTSVGSRSGNVTVTDSAPGSPHVVSLTGTGTAMPGISLSPSSVAFGSVAVGGSSAPQGVTLTNTGSGTLTIGGITLAGTNPGDFSQANTCGTSVAPGGACTVNITFKPTVAGSRSAWVSISDNAAGSPHSISVTGTGTAAAPPVVALTPTSLAFGDQTVGTTSVASTVTLTNTGGSALTISSLALGGANAGDFAQANTCGTSVAAGGSCTITVTFRPTAAGERSASVSITDNAAGSPHTVALSGTGLSVGPGPVSSIWVTTTVPGTPDAGPDSNPVELGVKFRSDVSGYVTGIRFYKATGNTGAHEGHLWTRTGAVLASASFAGETASGWQQVTFSTPVAIAANTTYVASYHTNAGHYSFDKNYFAAAGVDNAPLHALANGVDGSNGVFAYGPTQTFPASSYQSTNYWVDVLFSSVDPTLPAVTLSPTSVAFGSQTVGTTSPAGTVTVTNSGGSPLSIASIVLGGTDAIDFDETTTCGTSLAAGTSCTISVRFSPSAAASRTASISITSNAAGSPHTIGLSGTGTTAPPIVTLSPTSLPFGSQLLGTTSTASVVTLANTGGAALTIGAVAITGSNPGDFAQTNTCGTVLAAGASCTIGITFTPAAGGARAAAVAITDNAASSPHTVALTGTGTVPPPAVVLSSTSLSFGSQAVGATTPAQAVTLTNTGGSTLTIAGITVGGTAAGDFAQTNTCGANVVAGASCTISVTFTPTATGERTAAVTIADNAAGSPRSIALSGTGVPVGPAPASSIWASTVVPGVSDAGPDNAVELGVKFRSDASGYVTGLRFYKGAGNTGAHEGHLWTSAGVLLAGASFASETDSGWQQVSFPTPVAIAANTTYVASYHTNVGHYSFDVNYFSAAGVDNAPLHALKTGVDGSNGMFSYGPTQTFPTGSYQSTNYWVDVVFSTVDPTLPAVTLAPGAVAFGSQTLGIASAPGTVTLTNTGGSALTIAGIAVTGTDAGDFAQATTCGTSLAAGASCSISVTFTPTAAAARTAAITIATNAAGSPHAVALSGTGTLAPPGVTLSPSPLAFGSQLLGTTSSVMTTTLLNNGGVALIVSGIGITGTNAGDFAQSTTCGTSVPGGGSCTITVTFTPTAAGARTAAITVTDNAAGSPHTVAISGTGVQPAPTVGLSPTSLAFAPVPVNTTSAPLTVTLSNTGSGTLTISGITFAGSNPGDFAQTNTCGTSVAAGASCTISVTFKPLGGGSRSGTLRVASNAAGSPHSVTLTGTGTTTIVLSLSPTSVSFGNQAVGTTSAARRLTLANTGTGTMTFGTGGIVGTNAADFAVTNGTCGSTLAAGRSCYLNLTFSPKAVGARAASMQISSNATGSPHTVPLTGTGY